MKTTTVEHCNIKTQAHYYGIKNAAKNQHKEIFDGILDKKFRKKYLKKCAINPVDI